MIYDMNNHTLLKEYAPDLAGELLREQVELAEKALGLRASAAGTAVPVFTDTADVADIRRYLALQVGLQVAADPDSFLAKSATRGIESVTYRDGVLVHPVALAGVTAMLDEVIPAPDPQAEIAGSYITVRSLR